jgi:hypothetical protein
MLVWLGVIAGGPTAYHRFLCPLLNPPPSFLPPSSPPQAIKFLQQAVGLRGYAAKDPLTEFKLEGYNLFVEMTSQIRRNVIYNVYQFQPQVRS